MLLAEPCFCSLVNEIISDLFTELSVVSQKGQKVVAVHHSCLKGVSTDHFLPLRSDTITAKILFVIYECVLTVLVNLKTLFDVHTSLFSLDGILFLFC